VSAINLYNSKWLHLPASSIKMSLGDLESTHGFFLCLKTVKIIEKNRRVTKETKIQTVVLTRDVKLQEVASREKSS
jgi:hypothetical protein